MTPSPDEPLRVLVVVGDLDDSHKLPPLSLSDIAEADVVVRVTDEGADVTKVRGVPVESVLPRVVRV